MRKNEFLKVMSDTECVNNNETFHIGNITITYRNDLSSAIITGIIPLPLARILYERYPNYGIKVNGSEDNINPDEYAIDEQYEKDLEKIESSNPTISQSIKRSKDAKKRLLRRDNTTKYIRTYHIDSKEGLNIFINEYKKYMHIKSSSESNIMNLYSYLSTLKRIITSECKKWNVSSDRIESYAERIYGRQILAIAANTEYNYNANIGKVLLLLTVHGIYEALEDIQQIHEEKDSKTAKAKQKRILDILSFLISKEELEKIINEYNARETIESKLTRMVENAESLAQAKIYHEEGSIRLTNQSNNPDFNSQRTQSIITAGATEFPEIYERTTRRSGDDENFQKLREFITKNTIRS